MTVATEALSPRILIFGLSRADGRIPSDEVYRVGAACGLGRERIRSCVRRLEADGAIEREGPGRAAAFRLSEAGRAALHQVLDRYRLAYQRDESAGDPAWDGRWHLVAFTLDEASRPRRDLLRDRLQALGGVRLMGGLYVSANPWEAEVRAVADELDVRALITLSSSADLEVGGERDPAALAARFWPLAELDRDYRRFVARFDPAIEVLETMRSKGERLEDAVFFPAAFEMSVAFQACFERDPLLPAALLPSPWGGTRARELLLQSRRLALALRQSEAPPALFGLFDETTRDLR